MPETAALGIDFGLSPSQARFKERWLYVDVGVPSPLLSHPTLHAVPNPGWGHEPPAPPTPLARFALSPPAVPNPSWGHERLVSPRLSFIWYRLRRLRDLGVTAPRVVKEFLQCCVAPLQRHSRPMWALTGHQDRMRLQDTELAPEMLRKVLEVLTSDASPSDIRHGGSLMYLCSGGAEFAR